MKVSVAQINTAPGDFNQNLKNIFKGRRNRMDRFSEEFKCYDLKFVIGGDNVDKVPSKWYRGEELIDRFNFIIVPRVGYTPQTDWWKNPRHRIAESSDPNLAITGISSTEVRNKIKEKDFTNLMHESQLPEWEG